MSPLAAADDLHQAVDAARNARRRRRRRDAFVLNSARVAVLLAALILWYLVSLATSPLILPGPVSVATQLVRSSELIATNLWVTLSEIGLGFVAGSAIGIVVGTAIAHSRRLESIVRPYIATSQAVPKAALAPLFVLWLGFGLGPKVTIAALISFFPLLENTIVGLRRVAPAAARVALHSDGAQGRHRVRHGGSRHRGVCDLQQGARGADHAGSGQLRHPTHVRGHHRADRDGGVPLRDPSVGGALGVAHLEPRRGRDRQPSNRGVTNEKGADQ